jgi:hypothetical protein
MSLRLPIGICLISLLQVSLAQQSAPVSGSAPNDCAKGANLSRLIDEEQKRTPPELMETFTLLVSAPQARAPAQLVSTAYGFPDLLMAARLRNRSGKTIISYRIGWGYVRPNAIDFYTGTLMSVPGGVKPGRIQNVPSQSVRSDPRAEQVIFFIAELTFADGEHWTAKRKDILSARAELKNSR